MKLVELTKKDVGRMVIYRVGSPVEERGIITSWNKKYVFVRYGNNAGSQATEARDLKFEIVKEA